MTVSITASRVQYEGTSANTSLPTTFPFFDDTDLVLTQGTHYAVTGGNGAVGSVDVLDGINDFQTGVHTWTIQRRVPQTQSLDYVENDPFPAASHEEGLDRSALRDQDLSDDVVRSLKFPPGDSIGLSAEIPDSVARASKYLTFDAAGAPTVADAATASGTSVTSTDSTTARLLQDRFSEFVNVLDYGAQGTGLVDDSAAIQLAIDAAASAPKGVVFFPYGIYLITALALEIDKDNITLMGAGLNASILKVGDNATPDTSIGALFGILTIGTDTKTVDNITIADIGFDGNGSTLAVSDNNNIITLIGDGSTSSRIRIRNCRFTNAGRSAISTVTVGDPNTAFEHVQIEDCIIEDSGQYGIHLENARNVVISRTQVFRCGDHGISLAPKDPGGAPSTKFSRDCVISECIVDRSSPPADLYSGLGGSETGFLVAIGQATTRYTISNCLLNDNRTADNDGIGVGLGAGGANIPTDGIITNNIVRRAGKFGIDCTNRCVCANNLVIEAGTHGIVVALDNGGAVEEISIQNNTIIDANDTNDAATIAGIVLNSSVGGATARNVKITGNVVRDTAAQLDHGIMLLTVNMTITHLLIDGNILEDVTTNSIEINNTNVSEMILGSGNKLKKGQLYGAAALGAGTATVNAVGLPNNLDMQGMATRIVGGGANRGNILADYDSPNSQLVITSQRDVGAATEVNETSTVLWRILGTADAFV